MIKEQSAVLLQLQTCPLSPPDPGTISTSQAWSRLTPAMPNCTFQCALPDNQSHPPLHPGCGRSYPGAWQKWLIPSGECGARGKSALNAALPQAPSGHGTCSPKAAGWPTSAASSFSLVRVLWRGIKKPRKPSLTNCHRNRVVRNEEWCKCQSLSASKFKIYLEILLWTIKFKKLRALWVSQQQDLTLEVGDLILWGDTLACCCLW